MYCIRMYSIRYIGLEGCIVFETLYSIRIVFKTMLPYFFFHGSTILPMGGSMTASLLHRP